MTTKKLDIVYIRERLGWSQKDLADALEVAILTVQRWEKSERNRDAKSKSGKEKSVPGKPAKIPTFLKYALDYLLLKEGKKRTPTHLTIALPDTVGAALPTLANDHGFFKQQDLVVTIRDCETGTEALEDVYKGRAQVAGAAAGLLKLYKDTVIDLGIVMSSPRAFNVITYAEKRGLDLFEDSVVLHPKGSDLERLLVDLGSYYQSEQKPILRPVDRDEAVELLLAATQNPKSDQRNTVYVAWEPLSSRIHMELEDRKSPDILFRNDELSVKALEKALTYEFHVACSRKWYESSPSAAFDFVSALARADLEFQKYYPTHMKELWNRYGVPERTESDWIDDLAENPGAML